MRADHAEVNAITRARVIPIGSTLYCTHSPCADCTRFILKYPGIYRVMFQDLYRIHDHLVKFEACGIRLGQVTPNGIVTDPFTKEIMEGKPWD